MNIDDVLALISRGLRENQGNRMGAVNYPASLSSDSDEVVMEALNDMCTQLNMSTFVPVFRYNIVEIIPCLTKCLRRPGNLDMNLLAARVLTYLIDSFPKAITILAEESHLECILYHLKVMEDVELSEQCLMCLEKLCVYVPGVEGMYNYDGISAMLTFADFFTINSQRKIWSNISKICMMVKPFSFHRIRSLLPIIRAGATSEDLSIRGSAIRAMMHITKGVKTDPDLVDEAFGDFCPTLVPILLTQEKDEKCFLAALSLILNGVSYSIKVVEKVVSDEVLYSLLTLLTGAAAAAATTTLSSSPGDAETSPNVEIGEGGSDSRANPSSFGPLFSTTSSSSPVSSSPASPHAPSSMPSVVNTALTSADSLCSTSSSTAISFLLRNKKIKLSLDDTRLLSSIFFFLLPAVDEIKEVHVNHLLEEELKIRGDAVGDTKSMQFRSENSALPADGSDIFYKGREEEDMPDTPDEYITESDVEETEEEEGEEEDVEGPDVDEEEGWEDVIEMLPPSELKGNARQSSGEESSPEVEEEKEDETPSSRSGEADKEEDDNPKKSKKKETSLPLHQLHASIRELGYLVRNEDKWLQLRDTHSCDACKKRIFAKSWYRCNDCPDTDFCAPCLQRLYKIHPEGHTFTDVGELRRKAHEVTMANTKALKESRLALYKEKPALLERVLMAIPGVVQLSAETEVPSIRYYCLAYLIRAVHLASSSQLVDAGITSSSVCESISTALQHPILLTYLGIFLAHQLVKKMPSVFSDVFLREGIVAMLQKLETPLSSNTILRPRIDLKQVVKPLWCTMVAEPVSALLTAFPSDAEKERSHLLLQLSQLLHEENNLIPAFLFLRHVMLMDVTTFELVTSNVIRDLREALLRKHSIIDIIALIHILSAPQMDIRHSSNGGSTDSGSLMVNMDNPHSGSDGDTAASVASSSAVHATHNMNPLVRFVRHLQGILTFLDDFKAPKFGAVKNIHTSLTLRISPDTAYFFCSEGEDTTRTTPSSSKWEKKEEGQQATRRAGDALEFRFTAGSHRRGPARNAPLSSKDLFFGHVSVDPFVDIATISKCITRELSKPNLSDALFHHFSQLHEEEDSFPTFLRDPNTRTTAQHGSLELPREAVPVPPDADEEERRGGDTAVEATRRNDARSAMAGEGREGQHSSSLPTPCMWIRYKDKVLPPSMTVAQLAILIDNEEGAGENKKNSEKNTSDNTKDSLPLPTSYGSITSSSPMTSGVPRGSVESGRRMKRRPTATTTSPAAKGDAILKDKKVSPLAGRSSSSKNNYSAPRQNTAKTQTTSTTHPSSSPLSGSASQARHTKDTAEALMKKSGGATGERRAPQTAQQKSPEVTKQKVTKEEEMGMHIKEESDEDDAESKRDGEDGQKERGRNDGRQNSLSSASKKKENRCSAKKDIPELFYSLTPYTEPSYKYLSHFSAHKAKKGKDPFSISVVLPSEERYFPPAARPVLERLDSTFPWSQRVLGEKQMEVLSILGVIAEAVKRWEEIAPEVVEEVLTYLTSKAPNNAGEGAAQHNSIIPVMNTTHTAATSSSSSTEDTNYGSHSPHPLPPAELPAQWVTRLYSPSVSIREFYHQKLNNKAMQHCSNYLLAGMHMRFWAVRLALDCGFLFLPSTRKFMFDVCSCVGIRCLARMQQKIGDAGVFDSTSVYHQQPFLLRLQHTRVQVSRESVLSSAVKVFSSANSSEAVVWDFEFSGEEGIGSGPTKEFYTLAAEALRERQLNLWRAADEGVGGTHFTAPHGLFPRLLTPSPTSCSSTTNSKYSDSPTSRLNRDSTRNKMVQRAAIPFVTTPPSSMVVRDTSARTMLDASSSDVSSLPLPSNIKSSGTLGQKTANLKRKEGTEEKALSDAEMIEFWFEIIGRFISRALLDEHLPGLFLSPALLRLLRGDTCSVNDVRDIDPALYQILLALLKAHRSHTNCIQIAGVAKSCTVDELGLDFTVDGIPLCVPSQRKSQTRSHMSSPPSPHLPSPFPNGCTSPTISKQRKEDKNESSAEVAGSSSSLSFPFLLEPSTRSSLALESLAPAENEEIKEMARSVTVIDQDQIPMLDNDNIMRYCDGMVETLLRSGVQTAVEALRRGFNEFIPLCVLELLTVEELNEAINGNDAKVTRQEFSENCLANHGYTLSSKPIQWLFDILASFTVEDQKKFFAFLTGSEHLPIGGLASLNPKLTVVRKTSVEPSIKEGDQLPSAMTCQNYLKLPAYETKEQMEAKLRQAIMDGQGSFHLT